MIVEGDRVAVALSGGKDSTALLLLLSSLFPAWQNVQMIAITIDEGIAGYREATVKAAEHL
jgi:tRNA(Ile)-lysidine synthase TilS/MesJ